VSKKHPILRKNDKVIILSGKEKGKIGSVLKIDAEKSNAIVEKLNIVKRHSKAGARGAKGGIIEKESPIHLSNLMLVCNKCAEPARVGKKILDDGTKVRTCKKCGELLND
jgi:large subunit ribosomal protein L24